MDVSDIINKIYRLPQTSLDTLIDSVSEVEYPKNFHLHRENKKETKSYFIKKGIVRAYTHKDCILYEIVLERLQELYLNDIHIANWGRRYAECACIKSEKLFIARQFKTSLERYRELIGEYPDIVQRVQLGIIASYLGISQVSLSRIRARIR